MPLSKDPERRQRQLANLRRGRPRAPLLPGPLSALEVRLRQITPASPEVQRVLREVLSIQSELAAPTEADVPLLATLAQVLVVQRLAMADLLRYGLTDANGRERPAARIFLQAADVAARLCDRLGIGPMARSKLGLGGPKSLGDILAEALRASAEEVKPDGPDAPGSGVAA